MTDFTAKVVNKIQNFGEAIKCEDGSEAKKKEIDRQIENLETTLKLFPAQASLYSSTLAALSKEKVNLEAQNVSLKLGKAKIALEKFNSEIETSLTNFCSELTNLTKSQSGEQCELVGDRSFPQEQWNVNWSDDKKNI